MFLTFDDDWYEKRFNLHGIHDIKGWPCIKEIGKLHSPLNLYIVNQCDGLLLCLAEGIGAKASGMGPVYIGRRPDGLNSEISTKQQIGYDNNNNHKLLGLFHDEYDTNVIAKHEIYDFKSSSWRVLNIVTPRYFERTWKRSFDFTKEKLGRCMDLPFDTDDDDNKIPYSCVRGEQLAVLFQRAFELVIWITTKIEPDAVSWSNLFKEKKVAVVFGDYEDKCYAVGENGCYETKTGM
ncbi:hypothetical protein YC2023_055188 [Brassica napus]